MTSSGSEVNWRRRKSIWKAGRIAPVHFGGIIGISLALQKVLNQVAIVADSSATVLLLGETGTGKGLIARALHHASKRKDKPFVTLNCCCYPYRTAGKRTVWPRERCVYWSGAPKGRKDGIGG